jgi:hypothetical protein
MPQHITPGYIVLLADTPSGGPPSQNAAYWSLKRVHPQQHAALMAYYDDQFVHFDRVTV